MTECEISVSEYLRPRSRVCSDVISERFVMVRVCDDRAVNHNDLSIFYQLRVVLPEANAETRIRLLVEVRMARRQKSWWDPDWFSFTIYRVVVKPFVARLGAVCRIFEVQQSA